VYANFNNYNKLLNHLTIKKIIVILNYYIIMTKQEVQQRVLQNGKPLDLDKFNWCETTKTFSTLEHGLVLDFTGIDGYTFITGSLCIFITRAHCTFTTGSHCTFTTGSHCTFTTGHCCTFNTGGYCNFITRSDCNFKTGIYCTFNTGNYCTFTTGHCCTFNTGSDCTFITGSDCTFTTGSHCTFTTGSDCTFITGIYCVCVRKDVFEFFEIPKKTKIQLNEYGVKGFEVLEEIS
jgi:hypothetical protein